jgi:hypothetical protein
MVAKRTAVAAWVSRTKGLPWYKICMKATTIRIGALATTPSRAMPSDPTRRS